jgi:hypothetical protein
VGEDAGALIARVRHPALATRRRGQSVLRGQQVIDVRLRGREQVEVARGFIEQHLLDQLVGLQAERPGQLGGGGNCAVTEPHRVKTLELCARPGVGQHFNRGGAARSTVQEASVLRMVEQRVVGSATPEQEREARRDLVAVELKDAGLVRRRARFDPIQHLGILQHAAQHQVDGRVEVVGNVGVNFGREAL